MQRAFRPTRHVLHEAIGSEVVLLELASGVYYSLDGVGCRIWDLLIAGRSSPEIAATLTREYEVSHEQAIGDVQRLLVDLEQNGLIEATDA